MAEQLKLLKRKRGLLKGKITEFSKFVTTSKELTEQGASKLILKQTELKIRMKKLDETWNSFNDVQEKIEELVNDEGIDNEFEQRNNFETQYYAAVALAEHIISQNIETPEKESLNQDSNQNESVQSSTQETETIALPKLTLPSFDGAFEDWAAFYDTFKTVIHENESLTDITKFRYLQGALKGDASQVIHGLTMSASNYKTAWSILEKRYENKKSMIFNHIKAIAEHDKLHKESYVGLRNLLDNLYKHTRALKVLGEPVDLWDRLLIYMIAEKLDSTSSKEWEKQIVTRTDLPTLQNLFDFFEVRCQILQRVEKTNKSSSTRLFGSKTSAHLNTSNSSVCKICKNNEHAICQCSSFINKSPTDRMSLVKQLHLCLNCLKLGHIAKNCKAGKCRKCHKTHNTMLHQDNKIESETENISPVTVNTNVTFKPSEIILATATIKVKDSEGRYHFGRALLDGGSQSNFVTTNFATRLKSSLHNNIITVTGISKGETLIDKSTTLEIKSNKSDYKKTMEFLLIHKITCKLPSSPIIIKNLPAVELADENYNKPEEIDMLLGAEAYFEFLLNEQIKLGDKLPILQKTVFGWVISGPCGNCSKRSNHTTHTHLSIANKSLENKLEKFWKIEEVPETKRFSKEEQECEEHYAKTYSRDESGRFIVRYPFKSSPTALGESKQAATHRLKCYEKKAANNPLLKQQYVSFMKDYEVLGHMTKVNEQDEPYLTNYLPHHAVFKQNDETKKIRVVFDASCKTSTGLSLNDILKTGPTIQQNLFEIVTRFRQHQYVLTADVVKMYRQILIKEEERDMQRIIWRENPEQPIQIFTLNTVTYGTASAPYLAVKSLQQLAHDNIERYPATSQRILEDFYVDDILTGCDDLQELKTLKRELSIILNSGGFELSKWMSNVGHNTDLENSCRKLFTEENEATRTLGIQWNPFKDTFTFEVQKDSSPALTKRQILTKISKLFDPLGLLGPTITFAKLIMQKLWQIHSDWDELVPNTIAETWDKFQKTICSLNDLRIPRCIIQSNYQTIELHGFADASEDAYGAVIYLRSTNFQDEHEVRIVCSKSRVAPLKRLSLPRLELCAALLLSKLYKSIKQSLTINIQNETLWSDSTITLWWINTEPHKLKTFVANRVSEIQSITENLCWRHIGSNDNPADLLSRGCFPQEILNNQMWWNGPNWLKNNKETWPSSNVQLPQKTPNSILELKEEKLLCHQITTGQALFERYSSVTKIQRIVAYWLRFIKNTRNKPENRMRGVLTVSELDDALIRLIQLAQAQCFYKEFVDLKKQGQARSTSVLKSLNLFIDRNNLIRVGGRLAHANLSYNCKYPILLPKGHALTKLIVRQEHVKNLHAGTQVVLSKIRERFWPIAAKGLIRKVIHECVICAKLNAKMPIQLMGNLPFPRVNTARPFTNTGVDFCGPFETKIVRLRGKTFIKTYVAVFVCLATRAVHLELVTSLTTEAFLGALRRFISRRGKCTNLYCDNATNFVGAKNELQKMYEFLNSNQDLIQIKMSEDRINFHFIPPRSPHMGGIWEAAVKSAKTHFKKVAANAHLTFEEMNTLLAQIEACLNSRPLCTLSSDPAEESALTPSHFLIGEAPSQLPDPNIPQTALTYWQRLHSIYQHFWKRWSAEYLSTLQQRIKWQRKGIPVKVGDIVILREPTPPATWKLGRIIEVHSGSDGEVRVVSVKTASGVTKRAVQKLCVLPINHNLETDIPIMDK